MDDPLHGSVVNGHCSVRGQKYYDTVHGDWVRGTTRCALTLFSSQSEWNVCEKVLERSLKCNQRTPFGSLTSSYPVWGWLTGATRRRKLMRVEAGVGIEVETCSLCLSLCEFVWNMESTCTLISNQRGVVCCAWNERMVCGVFVALICVYFFAEMDTWSVKKESAESD